MLYSTLLHSPSFEERGERTPPSSLGTDALYVEISGNRAGEFCQVNPETPPSGRRGSGGGLTPWQLRSRIPSTPSSCSFSRYTPLALHWIHRSNSRESNQKCTSRMKKEVRDPTRLLDSSLNETMLREKPGVTKPMALDVRRDACMEFAECPVPASS